VGQKVDFGKFPINKDYISIKKDTQISKRQLAQILKNNHSAVDKHIESLKSKGV
jgi:biotin operon repressor